MRGGGGSEVLGEESMGWGRLGFVVMKLKVVGIEG